MNSTITGNIASSDGGALYSYAKNSGAVSNVDILNSILFGNYKQTTANDIYINDAGTLDMAYSIYGQTNVDPSADNISALQYDVNESNMQRVFENIVQDAQGRWIPVAIDPTVDKTIAIQKHGEATIYGGLLGKVGNDYYYFNMATQKWESFTNATTYEFKKPDVSADYGLTNGEVYLLASNVDPDNNFEANTRYHSPYVFNMGAHVLNGPWEDPSLHVTTLDDIIDITDFKISLREAIAYASNGCVSTIPGYEGKIVITFAPGIAELILNNKENDLGLLYEELRIVQH